MKDKVYKITAVVLLIIGILSLIYFTIRIENITWDEFPIEPLVREEKPATTNDLEVHHTSTLESLRSIELSTYWPLKVSNALHTILLSLILVGLCILLWKHK